MLLLKKVCVLIQKWHWGRHGRVGGRGHLTRCYRCRGIWCWHQCFGFRNCIIVDCWILFMEVLVVRLLLAIFLVARQVDKSISVLISRAILSQPLSRSLAIFIWWLKGSSCRQLNGVGDHRKWCRVQGLFHDREGGLRACRTGTWPAAYLRKIVYIWNKFTTSSLDRNSRNGLESDGLSCQQSTRNPSHPPAQFFLLRGILGGSKFVPNLHKLGTILLSKFGMESEDDLQVAVALPCHTHPF